MLAFPQCSFSQQSSYFLLSHCTGQPQDSLFSTDGHTFHRDFLSCPAMLKAVCLAEVRGGWREGTGRKTKYGSCNLRVIWYGSRPLYAFLVLNNPCISVCQYHVGTYGTSFDLPSPGSGWGRGNRWWRIVLGCYTAPMHFCGRKCSLWISEESERKKCIMWVWLIE